MSITVRAAEAFKALVGPGHVHSDQWHACWTKVQKQGHDESSAAAICTKSLGEDSFDRAAEALVSDSAVRELHLRTAAKATRTEQYDGREHLVVPVIALMEGVIHAVNASEPEYVPSRALAASVSSWNGRPVVLGHPTKDGRQISANDPKTLEAHRFGTIFNARMDGSRLCMEAWIDPVRLEALDADLLERVKAEKTIEVSVGAHVRTELKNGAHAGKAYKTSWRELSSDHLAFLPKTRGACSIEMGCGALRAAEGSYVTYEVAEGGLLALSGDESLDQRVRLVSDAVRAEFSKKTNDMISPAVWPRDTFEDYVIYDLDGKLFSVDYEIEDGVVTFVSIPMPVKVLPPQYVAAETSDDVLKVFEELRTLVGRRHSSSDQKMLQTMHDHAVSLGAECGEMKGASAWFADPTKIKALGSLSKSDCPYCDGLGQMGKKDCDYCDGSGKAKMKAASSASSSWLTNLGNLFKPKKTARWFDDPAAVKTLNTQQQSSWFTPGVTNFSFSAAVDRAADDREAALTAKEA